MGSMQVLAWLLAKMPQAMEALEGVLGGMDEEGRLVYAVGFMVSHATASIDR
jgi:hypothetical protein